MIDTLTAASVQMAYDQMPRYIWHYFRDAKAGEKTAWVSFTRNCSLMLHVSMTCECYDVFTRPF